MIGKTDNETIVLKLSHEERFADEKQEVIIFWGSYTYSWSGGSNNQYWTKYKSEKE